MGGKPCIRGLRVTMGTIVGLIAAGRTKDEVSKLYPYLEPEDIDQALAYAAWRVEGIDVTDHYRMKILIDMNLSPAWVPVLEEAGHTARGFHRDET